MEEGLDKYEVLLAFNFSFLSLSRSSGLLGTWMVTLMALLPPDLAPVESPSLHGWGQGPATISPARPTGYVHKHRTLGSDSGLPSL